ncbi:peptidoglycan recognition protein 1 [Notamacropus eugenii]|uniref:peptidoglycan recognition protein 1 n=1 Tax=Notamacropus eugenii TaxID=9315 RepID=UPI003B66B70F
MAHWLFLLLAALPALGQNTPKPQNMIPGCPDVVPRSEWRALPSRCLRPLNLPVEYVLVSHTAGNPCFSPSECEQRMRAIQNDHVQIQGYCDIVYNFLIGEDGLVYEGRGWSTQGAHADPILNPTSLGISFIGNFRNRAPAPRALRALQSLLRCGTLLGILSSRYIIRGQEEVPGLEFPTGRLKAELQKLPQYQG